ncbi:uncharacterized protein LOC131673908 [Phymastichus coffea]|uniref:uncharacterized protein LOC131673908 n=1 Tax=Phymastichus coffea TaxID=108790 RepID=UPI00273C20FD|nr:uncharacterized protein LOC131673908 [Phymastichus coffea]XP_058808268.1 uncharacterized protein LOC131673908 [Phymastichus coffea]XP_058808269.1 uncharacterized protein LOC131673908 [Phymastichus coffea]
MEAKAVIVSGEAPESDDESITVKTGITFPSLLAGNPCGTIIQGEAKESDDDNSSINSVSYMMDPANCSYVEIHKGPKVERSCVKYNSLLHKKLRECNKTLDRDIRELISTTVTHAVEELNETNRQLLKSELVLQETVGKFQTSASQFEEILNQLFSIADEEYFDSIIVKK